MTPVHPLHGIPADEYAAAWLRAWLGSSRSGDAHMVTLAQSELRTLAVQIEAIASTTSSHPPGDSHAPAC